MNVTVGGTLNTNSFQEISPSDIIIDPGHDKGTILHVSHRNSGQTAHLHSGASL